MIFTYFLRIFIISITFYFFKVSFFVNVVVFFVSFRFVIRIWSLYGYKFSWWIIVSFNFSSIVFKDFDIFKVLFTREGDGEGRENISLFYIGI